MRYSLRNIWNQEPQAIAEAVRQVLIVASLAGLIALDDKMILAIISATSIGLTLFTHQASTPVSNPTLASGTEVKITGSTDTVVIQPTPPGPTGVEGP